MTQYSLTRATDPAIGNTKIDVFFVCVALIFLEKNTSLNFEKRRGDKLVGVKRKEEEGWKIIYGCLNDDNPLVTMNTVVV